MSSSESAASPPALPGSPCLQGERVAFTGTLASMTHRQAHELVIEHGGTPTGHVSRQTTMLVIGEEGWPLDPDGQPSQKLCQAVEWEHRGVPIRRLNESQWLRLLGLEEREREVHRLYTPAMLSRLLDVPVHTIRRWERLGLIQAAKTVYRLPYFDYQEVTGARRIVELLGAGVSARDLETSLHTLREMLPGIERPLAELEVLERDSKLLYRDTHGLVEPRTGQRVFDFEPAAETTRDDDNPTTIQLDSDPTPDPHATWSAADWFREGCRLLDEDNPHAAIEAFRLCLMDQPGDPAAHFHLAEALYRSGNLNAAIERYHATVEADPDYVEGWCQLGSVYYERKDLQPALEAFQIALRVHPDYPDAHWQLADVLHQLGRPDEAVAHWQRYLDFDNRGPWAEQARQRIAEYEDQHQAQDEPTVDGRPGLN